MIVRTAEQIAEIWEDVILLRTFAVCTADEDFGGEKARLYITHKISGGAQAAPTRYIYLYGDHQKRLIIGAREPEGDTTGGLRFRPPDMIDVYEMMDEGDLVEVL